MNPIDTVNLKSMKKHFIFDIDRQYFLNKMAIYMSKRDLDRETLYNGVKSLVEANDKHLLLPQQKLFTLFSIAFQYFLYQSTKDPGHYILRIEDSYLAEKLMKKAKDEITRKFLQKIYLPRRIKHETSYFHLDFFNFQSWALTNDLPKEKIKGALIVKNTQQNPMEQHLDEENVENYMNLPKDFFLTTLTAFVPKTITIAYGQNYNGLAIHKFDFIEEEDGEVVSGVKISDDVDLSDID